MIDIILFPNVFKQKAVETPNPFNFKRSPWTGKSIGFNSQRPVTPGAEAAYYRRMREGGQLAYAMPPERISPDCYTTLYWRV